jgi:uncharacterized DUF497 family protein
MVKFSMNFEWDDGKNSANFAKHHVSFFEAQLERSRTRIA